MRAYLALCRKELAGYFYSPIAYVVEMFFLLLMGFGMRMMVYILAKDTLTSGVMQVLFGESFFFWVALLIAVPVITMRLLAEERRSGTIEGLLTVAVTERVVVLAKFTGALLFYVMMWLPTIVYAFIIRHFDAQVTVDLGPMLSSYIGVLLLGSFFISLGLLASSLTRNQVIAAMICFVFVGIAFFAGFIPYWSNSDWVRYVSSYFSPVMHMMDFSRGVVDTRPIVLYVTGTCVMLFATTRVVESGKWK